MATSLSDSRNGFIQSSRDSPPSWSPCLGLSLACRPSHLALSCPSWPARCPISPQCMLNLLFSVFPSWSPCEHHPPGTRHFSYFLSPFPLPAPFPMEGLVGDHNSFLKCLREGSLAWGERAASGQAWWQRGKAAGSACPGLSASRSCPIPSSAQFRGCILLSFLL